MTDNVMCHASSSPVWIRSAREQGHQDALMNMCNCVEGMCPLQEVQNRLYQVQEDNLDGFQDSPVALAVLPLESSPVSSWAGANAQAPADTALPSALATQAASPQIFSQFPAPAAPAPNPPTHQPQPATTEVTHNLQVSASAPYAITPSGTAIPAHLSQPQPVPSLAPSNPAALQPSPNAGLVPAFLQARLSPTPALPTAMPAPPPPPSNMPAPAIAPTAAPAPTVAVAAASMQPSLMDHSALGGATQAGQPSEACPAGSPAVSEGSRRRRSPEHSRWGRPAPATRWGPQDDGITLMQVDAAADAQPPLPPSAAVDETGIPAGNAADGAQLAEGPASNSMPDAFAELMLGRVGNR